jgi:hypothetical protein
MSLLGCSPLFYACLAGHTKLAKEALDNFRASLLIGSTTKFGATVVDAAPRREQLSTIELVLKAFSQQGVFATVQRYSRDMSIHVNTRMWNGQAALLFY